jgi:hypothetical protein
LSETGVVLTPELVLVSPELLAEAQQRQTKKRKAAMSSSEPANGTFFVDPAQPVPPVTPEVAPPAAPAPEPVAAPAAAAPAAVSAGSAPSAPMIDVPLGTLIFRAGLLAEEQLEDALQEGMRTGKRLGEVLIERGWLHERDLGRLLAGQKGLPFVEISASDAEPAALQQLPEEKAKLQVALPLRHEDGQLVVAVADPSNELMLENLRRALGAEPRLVVAPYADLVRSIGEAYGRPPADPAVAETVPAQPEAPEPEAAQPEVPQLEVPQPEAQPEPQLEAQPAPPAAPEPVAEPIQPLTPPAVTPLPTVLPPAEERAPETVQTPLAPPAQAEPAPQPAAVEPPVVPAIETVPPLHEQAAVIPEPVAPPVEPAPEVPAVQPPPAPEPVLQPPLSPPPAAEAPAPEVPAPPVEAPAPQAPVQEDVPGVVSVVVLRLRDGDSVEIGTFPTAAEAATRAQEVVAEIAAAEVNGTWPFFAQRYLRPDSILSVDLVEEDADKWLGSSVRRSWAGQQ